jgi:hypothetical protein
MATTAYGELMKRLVTARRIQDGKPIANNTRLYGIEDCDGNTAVAVKLHKTYVVIHHQDGSFTLNSGGWRTVTTKERMNAWSEANVWQDKGEWFVRWMGKEYPYQDRMRFYPDGKVTKDGEPCES